ncbi:MAG TPA: Ku protein [Tepidisphaeraceae bacterium]|jgi:DNA end-binding protein Ku
MAARSVWKGYIRFSLVSVPVKAYTANESGGGKITLNQLHKECGSRIKYQKVCPTHGEVAQADIVSGYEVSDDQYVMIDPEEVAKLRSKSDKTIGIEAFIDKDEIEARYFNGKMLYLVPDSPIGKKPYAMMHRLMVEEKKVAFATGVFSNKEQILLLRPVGRLIGASFLSYQGQIRSPQEFEPEVPEVEVEKKELELARTLINQLSQDDFDFGSYKDNYEVALEKLIEAKVAGKELVASPEEAEPQVINLMEALQKSLDQAKSKAKPAKIAAPSTADRGAEAATKRKRKTS